MKRIFSLIMMFMVLVLLPIFAVEDDIVFGTTGTEIPEEEQVESGILEENIDEEIVEEVVVESVETEVESNFESKEYEIDGNDKKNYLVEGGNENAINTLATKQQDANATIVESVNVAGQPYNLSVLSEEEKEAMNGLELRQFVSFETKSGKIFHLIIDHSKTADNVQMLTEVGEQDLLNLIEENADIELILNDSDEVDIVKKTTKIKRETSSENEIDASENEGQNSMNLIIMIIASIVAGGLGWYFKIHKPKKELAFEDDVDEADYIDDEIYVEDE